MNVLILAAERSLRTMLVESLQDGGHHCIESETFEEGVRQLKQIL